MGDLAFVAGATGYTGREVVRELCRLGVPTVAHVRPDSPRLEDWRARFQALGARTDTTPWTGEAMAEILKALQPSCVFALLGTVRARMKRARAEGRDPERASYDAVDYGLTMILLEAARAWGSSPRFIYLSASGVKPNAAGSYYRARARAEQALAASGIPYCIARPSFITGPDRDDAVLQGGGKGIQRRRIRPEARVGCARAARARRGPNLRIRLRSPGRTRSGRRSSAV
jgi:uncharacterized protein YbjT (DUF2867 family)